MSKNVQTSTLVFDFTKTDFTYLQSKYEIWEYEIPGDMKTLGKGKYAEFYTRLKEICGDIPYYCKQGSPKFYICVKTGSHQPLKREDEQEIPYEKFTDYSNMSMAHCWLNVHLANHFYKRNVINNNDFFLISENITAQKTGNEYVNVLRLNIRHNYKIKDKSLYEVWIDDSGTRMKKVKKKEYARHEQGKTNYLQKEIPYLPQYRDNELIALQQMSRKEVYALKDNDAIFIKSTDNLNRTQIAYHSIEDMESYMQSKCYLLDTFLNGFIEYLADLKVEVKQKIIKMQEMQEEKKKPCLDFKNFPISIVNGCYGMYKDTEKLKLDIAKHLKNAKELKVKNKGKVKNGSIFQAKLTYEPSQNDLENKNVLFMMDYAKDDFDIQDDYAPLNEGGYIDKYAELKRNHTVTQGMCMNEKTEQRQKSNRDANSQRDDSKKVKHLAEKYLDYKGIKYDKFILKYEVDLQQLYLKNVIAKPTSISSKLPHIKLLNEKLFICSWYSEKEKKTYSYVLYVEEDELVIKEWNSECDKNNLIKDITSRKDTWEDIYEKRRLYHKHNGTWERTYNIIISKDAIWEIEEISERIMYEEAKIKANLEERNIKYPKEQWTKCKITTGSFSGQQVREFNQFIYSEVQEIGDISYNDLREKEEYWDRIKSIFKIKKETAFFEYLDIYCGIDISGKKAGDVFKLFKGIWFDKETLQYYAGSKQTYDGNQDKGHQMRRIAEIEGTFQEKDFFPLLDVEFVRYGGYTVIPYPFALIGIYHDICKSSQK